MSARIPNSARGAAPPDPPDRPDGRPYRYELVTADWRGYGDTLAEIAELLIDGYEGLDENGRAAARLRYAADAQAPLQASVAAAGDLASCSAADRAVLLGPRDEPPTVADWRAPVPLVVVSAFYEPDSDLPRPRESGGGQILWIDPATDETLLVSLHEAGWLAVNARDDGAEG
jgi:hypothetical protein